MRPRLLSITATLSETLLLLQRLSVETLLTLGMLFDTLAHVALRTSLQSQWVMLYDQQKMCL